MRRPVRASSSCWITCARSAFSSSERKPFAKQLISSCSSTEPWQQASTSDAMVDFMIPWKTRWICYWEE